MFLHHGGKLQQLLQFAALFEDAEQYREQLHLENLVEELKPLDLDAYIIADPGVLATIRRVDPQPRKFAAASRVPFASALPSARLVMAW